MSVVQPIVLALCGIGALLVIVAIIRNRVPGNAVDLLLAVAEVAVLAQLVVGLIDLGGAPDAVSKTTYVGYLIGSVLILPVAWIWAQAERSRSGLGVLLVGLLVVPFLILRLHQVWPGHG